MERERNRTVRRPRRSRGRVGLAALAVVVLAATLGACGSSGGGSEGNKVVFSLGFSPNYGEEAFFNALQAGYYKDAGLDVSYVVPDSTQTAAKLVGVGRADAGEFFGLDPITAVGAGIPVKVAMTWGWGQLGLMADPSGPIQSVGQLKGKNVGVFASLPYASACRPKLLQANGLSEQDVNTVDVGFNAVTPLLSGKVEASEGGNPLETVTYQLEKGTPPRYFSYDQVCPPFLFGVFVNGDWASKNPDTASKFIEATVKGAKLGLENPVESHKLFTEKFPDLQQPQLQFTEWGKAACGPDSTKLGLGYNPVNDYADLIQLSKDAKLIPNSFGVDQVVTNDYLPKPPVKSSACQ